MNEFLLVSWFYHVRNAVSRSISCSMFACSYSGVRVAAFLEKLAHFPALVVKVSVVTTFIHQRPQQCSWTFSTFNLSGVNKIIFTMDIKTIFILCNPQQSRRPRHQILFESTSYQKTELGDLTSFRWTGSHSQLFFHLATTTTSPWAKPHTGTILRDSMLPWFILMLTVWISQKNTMLDLSKM